MDESASIQQVAGRGLPLGGDDIDTDRIIPARFMKCVTFEGLGQYAFHDERFDADGRKKEHPLNDDVYSGAEILIVNRNFGCGSSREHAPQSLMGFGFRAFIGESFAEIFAGNCTALGLPAVTLPHEEVSRLMKLVAEKPTSEITIYLKEKSITAADVQFSCDIPESYRQALINGTWDSTNLLLTGRDDIMKLEKSLPYRFSA
jgi:3-isopropylmalate/(R)-2-methylmalate dehydratase small subunit